MTAWTFRVFVTIEETLPIVSIVRGHLPAFLLGLSFQFDSSRPLPIMATSRKSAENTGKENALWH
jgi:hypothetical protein